MTQHPEGLIVQEGEFEWAESDRPVSIADLLEADGLSLDRLTHEQLVPTPLHDASRTNTSDDDVIGVLEFWDDLGKGTWRWFEHVRRHAIIKGLMRPQLVETLPEPVENLVL